jgi:class 3 adenylate cyclase
VHEAARISAIADAGEILASVTTVVAASAPTDAPPREVELKGIAERVAVQSIAWEG